MKIDERSFLIGLMLAGIAILVAITACLIFSPSIRLKLMPEGLASMNIGLIVAYMLLFVTAICLPITLLLKSK